MSNAKKSTSGGFSAAVATLAIAIAVVIGILIYKFLLGSGANFEGGDPVKGHPLNVLGTIHKGGFIVPILIAVNIVIVIFSIERLFTLMAAAGKGNLSGFVTKIKSLLSSHQIDAAISECDKQKGSLGNVVKAGLLKYKSVENDGSHDKESKVAAIQKELEEATSLELPMLSKNLVILSTCASIGTLIGLIGTVLGMIRSFAAMSNAGAPDTSALSLGISEALINTAFGITGSTVAIILYNYFSNRIDALTYSLDEASFTITQEFNASGK
jgi:biopolymer transport protein ExbB